MRSCGNQDAMRGDAPRDQIWSVFIELQHQTPKNVKKTNTAGPANRKPEFHFDFITIFLELKPLLFILNLIKQNNTFTQSVLEKQI